MIFFFASPRGQRNIHSIPCTRMLKSVRIKWLATKAGAKKKKSSKYWEEKGRREPTPSPSTVSLQPPPAAGQAQRQQGWTCAFTLTEGERDMRGRRRVTGMRNTFQPSASKSLCQPPGYTSRRHKAGRRDATKPVSQHDGWFSILLTGK